MLSAPGRVLLRPFRGYSELAALSREEAPTVSGGALRLAFVIGAVVASTAAGRLAPVEHLVAAGSFAWIPLVQLFAVAVAVLSVDRRVSLARAFALHLAGQGPAMIALLVVPLLCFVVPADRTAAVLLRVVPPLFVAALVWGGVLRYACFKNGLALSRGRAAIATALYTSMLVAIVVTYFFAMGQLGPLLS